MTALDPRVTLGQVATMYGYDPAAVISVSLSQDEAIIQFRLAATSGFTIVERGFLMTPSSRAQLDGMASSYGYDPATLVGVRIDQHQSQVRYRVTQAGGATSVQADTFGIPEPSPVPGIAATDTGKAPA